MTDISEQHLGTRYDPDLDITEQAAGLPYDPNMDMSRLADITPEEEEALINSQPISRVEYNELYGHVESLAALLEQNVRATQTLSEQVRQIVLLPQPVPAVPAHHETFPQQVHPAAAEADARSLPAAPTTAQFHTDTSGQLDVSDTIKSAQENLHEYARIFMDYANHLDRAGQSSTFVVGVAQFLSITANKLDSYRAQLGRPAAY